MLARQGGVARSKHSRTGPDAPNNAEVGGNKGGLLLLGLSFTAGGQAMTCICN